MFQSRGSSYTQLPNDLKGWEAILNIQNFNDHKCLLWCILACQMNLEYDDHPNRVNKYKYFEDILNMQVVTYPTAYTKITRVENQNLLHIQGRRGVEGG